MITINMLSSAHRINAQGVGSAFLEQVHLVTKGLEPYFHVDVNRLGLSDIMHYHTIDPKHFVLAHLAKNHSVNIGYVHFLPETLKDSLDFPSFVTKMLNKYIIAFYKKMDFLVTVNPIFIGKLEELGIPASKITYISNFVSLKNFFEIDPAKKPFLKSKYSVHKNNFVVLGVGQIQTRKGIMDFIETAQMLPDVKFIWAGGFPFGKITSGYSLLKRVTENPPPNVKFVGILDRDQMNEIYNIADVMFLPSYNELFPMTILEAFNCKVPVLLRDIDIYPEICFDYYLKGFSCEAFRDHILALQNDENLRTHWQNMSWKGHKFYSQENILPMWENFYNKAYMHKFAFGSAK